VRMLAELLPPGEVGDQARREPPPRHHRWVEGLPGELAGVDRALFESLMAYEPALASRSMLLQEFWNVHHVLVDHDDTTLAVQTLLDRGGWVPGDYGLNSRADAERRVRDRSEQERPEHLTRLSAARNAFLDSDGTVRAIAADIQKRLHAIIDRPVPRFPWPAGEDLSPQKWS
jgi:hypothetical protein